MTVAVVGKGGTGKTTISALIIQLLSAKGVVLAVDADPSTNLNQALGLDLIETVGSIREKMDEELKGGTFSPGLAKKDFLDRKIRGALVESENIDLLAMGRPEGPGCYCSVNNILRALIDQLTDNYDYVIMDCEAGMEHISRQTTKDIDFLIIASDPTMRSLTTAIGMKELMAQLRTHTGKVALVINRLAKELPQDVYKMIESQGFDPLVTIPEDEAVYDLEIKGRPIIEIPEDAPVRRGIEELLSLLGIRMLEPISTGQPIS